MSFALRLLALAAALAASACVHPSDRRPGMRLRGEVTSFPADWSFTAEHQEIALEVSGFLGLPHSVTIWCADLDGMLYVGASNSETKRWPAWADADPDVRLRIGERIYEVRLVREEDAARLERLGRVYAAKYDLASRGSGAPPIRTARYWRVAPRS